MKEFTRVKGVTPKNTRLWVSPRCYSFYLWVNSVARQPSNIVEVRGWGKSQFFTTPTTVPVSSRSLPAVNEVTLQEGTILRVNSEALPHLPRVSFMMHTNPEYPFILWCKFELNHHEGGKKWEKVVLLQLDGLKVIKGTRILPELLNKAKVTSM